MPIVRYSRDVQPEVVETKDSVHIHVTRFRRKRHKLLNERQWYWSDVWVCRLYLDGKCQYGLHKDANNNYRCRLGRIEKRFYHAYFHALDYGHDLLRNDANVPSFTIETGNLRALPPSRYSRKEVQPCTLTSPSC